MYVATLATRLGPRDVTESAADLTVGALLLYIFNVTIYFNKIV